MCVCKFKGEEKKMIQKSLLYHSLRKKNEEKNAFFSKKRIFET